MSNATVHAIRTAATMPTLAEKLEFIRNGMNVRRYHQRYTAQTDTVGQHSCGVALLAELIDPECHKNVIVTALAHDLPEWLTGDIPAPVKRLLPIETKRALNSIETQALSGAGLLRDLSLDEEQLLKLCDYLEGLLYSTEEMNRGNRGIRDVGNVYVTYINTILAANKTARWWPTGQMVAYIVIENWEKLK